MAVKSKTLFKEIRRVFFFSEMHALIARLSVLYEDLRIETFGIIEEELPRLDYTDKSYRKNYFLRRSVGTLIEVAEAIRMLDQNPDFQLVKASFDDRHRIRWNRAIRFFKRFQPLLQLVRNDIGGHFGHAAARYAIQNMESSVVGRIEIAREAPNRAGVKLHFAGEIVVNAMLRHRRSDAPEVYVSRLYRIIALGYGQAIKSIDSINAYYLWNRFRG